MFSDVLDNIISGSGLWPIRHKSITRISAEILSFMEMHCDPIDLFPFMDIHLKMW